MSDDTDNLHDLTKFLLDRMKTYPEEFQLIGSQHTLTGDGSVRFDSRWAPDIDFMWRYGAAPDREALRRGLMDFQFRDTLKRLLVPEKKEEPVGQSSAASWVSYNPSGNAGNGGPGGYGGGGGTSVTLGATADRTTTLWYDTMAARHVLDVRNVGTVTMTREVAEDLGLKSKETIIEALKRKLGL
jgi:hypothetical protein